MQQVEVFNAAGYELHVVAPHHLHVHSKADAHSVFHKPLGFRRGQNPAVFEHHAENNRLDLRMPSRVVA